jgi:citrate synthase
VRWLTAIALRRPQISDRPIHAVFSDSLKLNRDLTELVRRMLVLSADHAFEPGTLAVRAVASTGVTPWRAVLTGLSVASGRRSRSRHHGSTAKFVDQIIQSQQPAADVVRRLRDGETLPGFSSPAYAIGDPRGKALLNYCAAIFAKDAEFRRLDAALSAVKDITGAQPSFALANMFARHKLGLERSDAPFVVGRACGWIAHSIEQFQLGEIDRGRPLYNGPLPEPSDSR